MCFHTGKSTSDSGHRRSGGSGGSVRSIVKAGEVDERYLIAPGRGEDTVGCFAKCMLVTIGLWLSLTAQSHEF